MLKIKKIVGLIALASVLISGIAFASPGCGDSACGAPIAQLEVEESAEQGISISDGFSKLWKQTGIYGFLHPKTDADKHAEFEAACIKTVEAEISAGHFSKARDVIRAGADRHVDDNKCALPANRCR